MPVKPAHQRPPGAMLRGLLVRANALLAEVGCPLRLALDGGFEVAV